MRAVSWALALLLLGAGLVPPLASAGSLAELFAQTPAPLRIAAGVTERRAVPALAAEVLDFQRRLQLEEAAIRRASPSVARVADSPALATAIRGYEQYRAGNSGDMDPAAVLSRRTRWLIQGFDLLRRQVGRQTVPDHDPIREEGKAWSALFRDWQALRGPLVRQADQQISAIGDPQAIADPARRAVIQAYRLAVLHEIETQLSITRLSIERSGRPETAD